MILLDTLRAIVVVVAVGLLPVVIWRLVIAWSGDPEETSAGTLVAWILLGIGLMGLVMFFATGYGLVLA